MASSAPSSPLALGYYQLPLSVGMAAAIDLLPADIARHLATPGSIPLGPLLADKIREHAQRLIEAAKGDTNEECGQAQLRLASTLLAALDAHDPDTSGADATSFSTRGVLTALLPTAAGATPPETGLCQPWLFTASKGSPSLLSELRRELSDCDSVDILVSFITLSGVRRLEDALEQLAKNPRGGRPPVPVRILTTTYTGATEQAALDRLAALPNTRIRISLDGRRTRLHAKAWIFQRSTGFGSAFIGSANLSAAALLGGLEWTVKLTQAGQSDTFEKARAHFETLWNDREFESYDPTNQDHRDALGQALRRESGASKGGGAPALFTFFELTPKTYQQEFLEQLAHERAHGRCRNLLVAATGTGKTMIAAFDYRAQCAAAAPGARPRLLFVAHRQEILQQSLATYRAVLRDQSFGELLFGGHTPASTDHLFATIQSTLSTGLLETHPPTHWDIVVIDECHHLAAASFTRFVTRVQPRLLLGLTATPERGDGESIARFFDSRPDGTPSCELRLWQALDLQLLSPFEYHVADDPCDYAGVPWNRSGESAALDTLVSGNQLRAQAVIDAWVRLSGDPRRCRALAFCVNVAHAEFMAAAFNAAGIPAACLHGGTGDNERLAAPQRLRAGTLSVITTCELYNEGVDLPFVDTLLLLRPTQSPVIFQQQIGRGLRLHEGKTACLILDFVGNTDEDFRYDRLYGGLFGMTRRQLIEAIENDFSHLPAGCVVRFTKRSREQVLSRLRLLGTNRWRNLCRELASYCILAKTQEPRLVDFLRDQGISPSDIYRETSPAGWAALKRGAGLPMPPEAPEEAYLGKRLCSLLHIDSDAQIAVLAKLAGEALDQESLTSEEGLLAQMITYQVDGTTSQVGSWRRFRERLEHAPAILAELRELAAWLEAKSITTDRPIPGMEDLPLRLHAHYDQREILTAVGWLTADKRIPFQAGVLGLPSRKTELLLVTLDKTDALHAAVAYHDYALAPDRFHWQSQNSAAPTTEAGCRYLESTTNGWSFQLFVRPRKGDPYCALGPVTLLSSEGARPMSITWQLAVPMPAAHFAQYSVLRAV